MVLAGSSLPLTQPKAISQGLEPVDINLSTPAYSSQKGLGTVQAGAYTAGPFPGTDTIQVTSGSLSGQFQLHVVDQLTDLQIGRAGGPLPSPPCP